MTNLIQFARSHLLKKVKYLPGVLGVPCVLGSHDQITVQEIQQLPFARKQQGRLRRGQEEVRGQADRRGQGRGEDE